MFGERMVTSYSRIEKYRECPFKYFCTYTLKLSPEPKASLGAPEIGNTVHKILEELVPVFVRMNENGEEIILNQGKTWICCIWDQYQDCMEWK